MKDSSERPIITLLSDYGSLYPAQMKGPILSRTRDAVLVEIAHDVPPQDVRAGAFALMAAPRHFPAAKSLGEPAAWMIGPAFFEGSAPTFHGRDVFALEAAAIAKGAAPGSFGPRVAATDLETGPAEISGDGMVVEVVYVDGFGNVITNATEIPWEILILAGRRLSRARTYAEAGPDEPLITIGSHGFAEIAVNGGSAKDLFGLATGDRILLERGNCSE